MGVGGRKGGPGGSGRLKRVRDCDARSRTIFRSGRAQFQTPLDGMCVLFALSACPALFGLVGRVGQVCLVRPVRLVGPVGQVGPAWSVRSVLFVLAPFLRFCSS